MFFFSFFIFFFLQKSAIFKAKIFSLHLIEAKQTELPLPLHTLGECLWGQYQIWQDIAAVSGVELEEDVSGVHLEIFPLPQQSIRESKNVLLERTFRCAKVCISSK